MLTGPPCRLQYVVRAAVLLCSSHVVIAQIESNSCPEQEDAVPTASHVAWSAAMLADDSDAAALLKLSRVAAEVLPSCQRPAVLSLATGPTAAASHVPAAMQSAS